MYGKTFESMYEGSMFGAGLEVWGVWNYVITKTHFEVVELNPKLLAAVLGCTPEQVEEGIAKLCAPDPNSRSKAEDGRRLVREGQFQYRVVNWAHYQSIRHENDRREYNRTKMAEYRAKKRQAAESTQDVGDASDGATQKQRMRRANEKIARAEAIESKVREKFNPGAGGERVIHEGEHRLTAGEIVKRRIEEDPITKADREALKRNRSKVSLPTEPDPDTESPAL